MRCTHCNSDICDPCWKERSALRTELDWALETEARLHTENTQLKQRVGELEKALKPVAALRSADSKLSDDTQIAGGSYSHGDVPILTIGDIRRARAALRQGGGGSDG